MEREKNVESKMNIKRNILIFPLIMVQIYLVGVIFLYVLGPWEWPTHKPALFYLLIFLYQLFFGLGYLLSINKSKRSVRNLKPKSVDRFLAIMIIINFIYVIFNFLHTVGLNSFSISNIIDAFVNGILNPSVQYKMKFSADKFGGSYFTYFSVLMAPVMWSVFPLSIYNFKRLKLSYKLIVLISLFFELARWIATGTSKGIIDVILIILVVTVVKYMKKRALDNRNRIFDFKKYRFRILVLSLIVVGVFFFSNNVGDRVNQNWSNYIISNGNVNINVDAPLMKITPNSMKPTLIYLTSYLTQGYYAFSMSLDLDYYPMLGVGNSMFLMENFNEIFDLNLYEKTYQNRMSVFGWHPFVNWHSFYVWVANDVHYIGVILVMFLIGYLLGSVYKNVILYDDPIALVLLCLTTIMIIYIPANNQLLSYPTTFMAFWITLIYWNVRKRYKFVLRKNY
jgi:hypothetical protein